MGDERPLITPQTKVGDLLSVFPELEDVLVEIAPAFRKLRNPVLRKTVARVTSLAQVARVGDISVVALIQRLRREVNQPDFREEEPKDKTSVDLPPAWLDKERIVRTLDARPMIEAGEQPMGRVLRDLEGLNEEEIYELLTPFEPAPLIDRAKQKGLRVWLCSDGGTEFHTYFCRE